MADEKYIIGAIDGASDKVVIDINPIVESEWFIDENNNVAYDAENKKNYSSNDILKACVEYMSNVPFICFRSEEPENKHVGIWMDTKHPVPERTYARKNNNS